MTTFPITGRVTTSQGVRTIRRNAETGVEIWSGESGLGDRVMIPSRIDPSGLVQNFKTYRNLAKARQVAAERADDIRLLRDMAHGEALDEMTTTTITATVTPTDGQPAWLVECTCATHPKGMTRAIVRSSGTQLAADRVHGSVTLAHSPAGALAARMPRPNVWKA